MQAAVVGPFVANPPRRPGGRHVAASRGQGGTPATMHGGAITAGDPARPRASLGDLARALPLEAVKRTALGFPRLAEGGSGS